MRNGILSVVVSIAVVSLAFTAVASKVKEGEKDTAAQSPVSGAKLGYVDLNRALNEVNDGKTAKARLEADGKAKKQKLEIMQGDIRKLSEELEKQKLILSADALREKQQLLQQKLMEMQKTTMEFEKQFAEAETSAIKPISEKLQRIIQRIGSSEGYMIIVPREMALYSPAGSDLTDRVIAEFNKGN